MKNKNTNINDFIVVDLFAGAGGLGTGLMQAGFTVALAIEIDPIACKTYSKNHPNTEVWCNDIKEITGEMIRSFIYFKYGNKKVILAGGPPCQSWSKYKTQVENSRRGFADQRGRMLFEYVRIMEELQPDICIFENVSYLVSKEHLPSFQTFKRLLFQKTNLQLDYKVLNALNYGVAQKRDRVILIGVKKGIKNPFSFLKEVHGPKTLHEQLKGITPDEFPRFKSSEEAVMRRIKPGECWNVLSIEESMRLLGKHYLANCNKCKKRYAPQNYKNYCCPYCGSTSFRNSHNKQTVYYRRLRWDRPCYTVCTVSTTKIDGPLTHPDETRGLSISEISAVQRFPKKLLFCTNYAR